MQLLELSQDNRYVKVELPPPFSPSKSWYNDNAGVEEVIFVGTVGVVKVLEDISVKSCFNFVLDIIHQCRYCTGYGTDGSLSESQVEIVEKDLVHSTTVCK